MHTFIPGSFLDLAGTKEGKNLWNFLNSPEAVIRLETTTYLKRPALEGLQPQLLETFGPEKKTDDRWKQMAGRMVRQLMEHRGYTLDQTSVRIRGLEGKELFSSAARYKKLSNIS